MSPTLIHLVFAAAHQGERTEDVATRSRRVRTTRRSAAKRPEGR
jgi:hypothetical protein